LNSLLSGLAIPTAISATGAAARTLQTLTQPFSQVLETALNQLPNGGARAGDSASTTTENTSRGSTNPSAANDPRSDPHLALLGELLTGEPIQGLKKGIQLPDIRSHADSLRDDLERRLQQALREAGVDMGTGGGSDVRLRISPSDGVIEVLGDHPQRVAIEAVFAGDPQLSSDFRQLVSINQLLQAADENRGFADAYEENPLLAVSEYQQLFQGRQEVVLNIASNIL